MVFSTGTSVLLPYYIPWSFEAYWLLWWSIFRLGTSMSSEAIIEVTNFWMFGVVDCLCGVYALSHAHTHTYQHPHLLLHLLDAVTVSSKSNADFQRGRAMSVIMTMGMSMAYDFCLRTFPLALRCPSARFCCLCQSRLCCWQWLFGDDFLRRRRAKRVRSGHCRRNLCRSFVLKKRRSCKPDFGMVPSTWRSIWVHIKHASRLLGLTDKLINSSRACRCPGRWPLRVLGRPRTWKAQESYNPCVISNDVQLQQEIISRSF